MVPWVRSITPSQSRHQPFQKPEAHCSVNQYKFSEFASRREIVRQALKQLVLDGLVWSDNSAAGILYSITDAGREYSAILESEYAGEYRSTARKIVEIVSNISERTIIDKINKMSAESLRKGARA